MIGSVVYDNSVAPVIAKSNTNIITDAYKSNPPSNINAEIAPLSNRVKVIKKIEGRMYVKAKKPIKVFSSSTKKSPVLAKSKMKVVPVTGEKKNNMVEIVYKDAIRWVKAEMVTTEKPEPEVSMKPCPEASEKGIQPDTIRVIRSVCAKFPEVLSYGTLRLGDAGDHGTGRAVDIMVNPSSEIGTEIAAYLQAHREELGVDYLIWRQRIWRLATVDAWRMMENRGSPTANHMDHVHASVYGNVGTAAFE